MLIYTRHDPRFYDKRLFKGGDGGAGEARQAEAERQAKVQAGVDAINTKFGVAPATAFARPAAPTRDAFTVKGTPGAMIEMGNSGDRSPTMGFADGTPDTFDEAGYNAAVTAANALPDPNAQVNANKTEREKLYTDISGATFDANKRALDKQSSEAQRQNLFGLARSGLVGGSVDAESNGDLAGRYGEGLIQAKAAGNQAAAGLREADEKTRQNLVGLAQSGLDTGTAASLAAGQLGSAAEAAKAASGGVTLGNVFNDLSQGYLQNTVNRARFPNGVPQQPQAGFFSNLFSGNGYAGTVKR